MELKKAINLYHDYKLDEAREAFENMRKEYPENIEILLYLGKIHQRTQNYGEAMNCFHKVLDLEAENEQAKTGLQLIKNILQLTNNFYFENAYTDDNLYEFD